MIEAPLHDECMDQVTEKAVMAASLFAAIADDHETNEEEAAFVKGLMQGVAFFIGFMLVDLTQAQSVHAVTKAGMDAIVMRQEML